VVVEKASLKSQCMRINIHPFCWNVRVVCKNIRLDSVSVFYCWVLW